MIRRNDRTGKPRHFLILAARDGGLTAAQMQAILTLIRRPRHFTAARMPNWTRRRIEPLMRRIALALLVMLALSSVSTLLRADEPPLFRIEIKDGVISPKQTEVPANRDFKLEVANTGSVPAEFESKQLRQEKVLAPGKTVTITIRAIAPGEYQFVDEFHENEEAGQGVIVAK
jgi:hypothetical protein